MIVFILILCTTMDESQLYEHEGTRDIDIIAHEVESLSKSPIPINSATFEKLCIIPFISSFECQRIIDERDKNGAFKDSDDLKRIPGFDDVLIARILPFITFKETHNARQPISLRMRATTLFPWTQYREEIFGRTICQMYPYTFYSACEKDANESQYLDYWTAGLVAHYDSAGTFAFGKYNLDLGTGVMLSPIGSFYSTTDFHYMIRERGILPYTSVNENSGFFGAAVSDSMLLKFTLFYSNQKLDGRIDSLGFARSFDLSGDHVDSASQDHKDRINEELAGYDIGCVFGRVRIAQRSYWCRYEPSFACLDSFSRFYGDAFIMSGIQIKYTGDMSGIFAEIARSNHDRFGGVWGCSGELPYADITVTARYFPIGYYSPKGAEAENGAWGGVIAIQNRSRVVPLRAEIDIHSDLGSDVVLYNTRLTAERKIKFLQLKIQMRWRYLESALDLSGSRVFLRLQPSRNLWADLRLEERYVFCDSTVDQGLFGCLELGTRIFGITMRMRYGLFSTESYDARMYIYEIDLPGVVNNRMIYGKGSYGFIYCTIKPNPWLSFSAKYATTWKDTVATQKVGCQIDWTLP